MNGQEFISQVAKTLESEEGKTPTERRIADHLSMTVQSLSSWRKRASLSARQVVSLMERIDRNGRKQAERGAIAPIVEFFEIDHNYSDRSERCQILNVKDEDQEHPYKAGVKRELSEKHGIYIFHDSRGRALYVGQAKTQSLWNEMNSAFNRTRQIQKIRKTSHPERKQDFRTYDEVRRQIGDKSVLLHQLAYYFSAYDISSGMISGLEALLVRGFANDLLNKKMENFK